MANQGTGKAASEIPALKPDWGKPAVRNFREGDGNSGIIEARQAPLPYPTRTRSRQAFTDVSARSKSVSGKKTRIPDFIRAEASLNRGRAHQSARALRESSQGFAL